MPDPREEIDRERRIHELEDMVHHLEETLDHFLHNRTAATELAKRNHIDVSQFGLGAVLRGLPRSVQRSAAFRLNRLRHRRKSTQLNRAILQREPGEIALDDWRPRAPLPAPRWEARAAVVLEDLYVFAGFRPPREQVEPSSWKYDPVADTWHEIAPMPLPVTHSGIGVVGTDAWLVGGFVGSNPGPATTRVQIYDTAHDRWRSGPSLPSHVASAATAMDGTRLHMVGGLDLDRKTDLVDHLVLDTSDPAAAWVRMAPLPAPGRNHHSALGLNGRVYVMGGHTGHDGPLVDLKIAHVYEPESDSWRRIADLPEERHHCEASTFAWQGRVVVAGGLGRWRVASLPDLVAYNPVEDAWTSIGPMPTPLWGAVVQPVGGVLIVTTGAEHSNKGETGKVWSYPLG